ncbi:MAG: hypothetical protein P1U50_01040 [Parvibaculaceae bacterium]|nr:hypothetical protein [Parvibaculaceae bacterium]
MNKHKDLSFTAKVIYSMVIGERTLVETGVRVGAKADQVKSCLRSALSDFVTIRARWKLEELPPLNLSDLERIEG